ncbi:PPOX class probable FMN-dependent enzyme [Pseudorhizobium tarimense]|uniref:PPOX class probable FMN-dependent enzyme n=1 Tax=Pseudorhizobium tarimense TaxID=1079109 RepID=A0ABV2H2U1_9HYPH|nr:pyridoxamine 5'-phosphate oxidase family protein [Pseudorhizobium tarimense]MCJ8518143.1 pyridoxamine 5'-phosphate oxidase family protein [Pseudorhizobium tarimense]
MTIITSIEQLKQIYGDASEASMVKVTRSLTAEYQRMIEASPFVALSTVGPEGLDCSPRGDAGSCVRVKDKTTLLLPDWRGNNRIDSLLNIVRDPRVALMFLIPGSSTAMRVNGKAVVSVEPDLLQSFGMDGRHPRTVVVITIVEVYFQCARAIMRAELWNPQRYVDANSLPSPGMLLKAAKADFDQETYDREWAGRAAATMW